MPEKARKDALSIDFYWFHCFQIITTHFDSFVAHTESISIECLQIPCDWSINMYFFHLYWNLNNEKPWILMWPTDKISEIFFHLKLHCVFIIVIHRLRFLEFEMGCDVMWCDGMFGIICHLYSDLFF